MTSRAASVVRDVTGRGVHIRIQPRPRSFAEKRQVKRVLEQFGRLDYYRYLGHDLKPKLNVALAIFNEERAAQMAIVKSPIRFRMSDKMIAGEFEQEPPRQGKAPVEQSGISQSYQPFGATQRPVSSSTSTGAWGLNQSRSLTTGSLPKPPREPVTYPFYFRGMPKPEPPGEEQPAGDERVYTISIRPSTYDFYQKLQMGPHHGSYENEWKKCIGDDLRHRVPLKGIANLDWKKPTKSATTLRAERSAVARRAPLGGYGSIAVSERASH